MRLMARRELKLVLTLNTFEFNGEIFSQISGVAMGTKMGPSYACLFMGYLEYRMQSLYTGPVPELYKRYIDDGRDMESHIIQRLGSQAPGGRKLGASFTAETKDAWSTLLKFFTEIMAEGNTDAQERPQSCKESSADLEAQGHAHFYYV
nr:hypothetical protein BaRGS_010375 [Batillaria attramentaria]